MKVAKSQSWKKEVDFSYKISKFFPQKWPIMSCIQTWPSTWNLHLTKKDGMKYTYLMEFWNLNHSKYPKIAARQSFHQTCCGRAFINTFLCEIFIILKNVQHQISSPKYEEQRYFRKFLQILHTFWDIIVRSRHHACWIFFPASHHACSKPGKAWHFIKQFVSTCSWPNISLIQALFWKILNIKVGVWSVLSIFDSNFVTFYALWRDIRDQRDVHEVKNLHGNAWKFLCNQVPLAISRTPACLS